MTDSQLSEVESAKTKVSSFRKSETSDIIIRTIDEVEAGFAFANRYRLRGQLI